MGQINSTESDSYRVNMLESKLFTLHPRVLTNTFLLISGMIESFFIGAMFLNIHLYEIY